MKSTIYFRRWSENTTGDWIEPVDDGVWEIAYSAEELEDKLDGAMATVDWPAAPWYVRWWRAIFPLKMIEGVVAPPDTAVIQY